MNLNSIPIRQSRRCAKSGAWVYLKYKHNLSKVNLFEIQLNHKIKVEGGNLQLFLYSAQRFNDDRSDT
jgi:hypothetical protein